MLFFSCAVYSVMDLYPKGTTIRNTRQLSILSAEEICQMASNLHLPSSTLDPHSMGASMVLEGLPDLSHLPPNSRLQLQNQDGTTLTIGKRQGGWEARLWGQLFVCVQVLLYLNAAKLIIAIVL